MRVEAELYRIEILSKNWGDSRVITVHREFTTPRYWHHLRIEQPCRSFKRCDDLAHWVASGVCGSKGRRMIPFVSTIVGLGMSTQRRMEAQADDEGNEEDPLYDLAFQAVFTCFR